MIEIKNNDKKVILENISENEPNKIIVRLDIKDGLVIPKKSIYQFDTGLEIICSKKPPRCDASGCFCAVCQFLIFA